MILIIAFWPKVTDLHNIQMMYLVIRLKSASEPSFAANLFGQVMFVHANNGFEILQGTCSFIISKDEIESKGSFHTGS